MDEEWVSVADIAKHFGIAQETVRRWLRNGRLKGVRLSDRSGWRVRRTEVARFVADLELSQQPEIKAGRPRKREDNQP